MKHPQSVISFMKPHPSKAEHPTQKPLKLFEYLIKTYTNEGDLILDNCIGSGTTAVACIRTKRNFIGIEISQEYCDIANRRLAQKTLKESLLNIP
jgi:DNA modification methylase